MVEGGKGWNALGELTRDVFLGTEDPPELE